MNVEQKTWNPNTGWSEIVGENLGKKASLVLAFGPGKFISKPQILKDLKVSYPHADIVLASSTHSIFDDKIKDDIIVVSTLQFEKTQIQALQINIKEVKDSFDAGMHLSANLNKDNLKGLIVFSDSLPVINGSHLLTGIHFNLSSHIPVTGGLASNSEGNRPIVGLNEIPKEGNVVGIGLSGDHILFGHGMDAGWTAFGTERFVTKSINNVVYQLDHLTPFELYKLYLDGLVDDVSVAARQFPLGLKLEASSNRKIRALLKFDTQTGEAIFSGDVPVGEKVRMMKTNVSSLIDSAGAAALQSCRDFGITEPDFSLIVNCIGRQDVLKEWAQEEIDAVVANLGKEMPIMGFYSLGELAPMEPKGKSELLNQTIIITSLKEI